MKGGAHGGLLLQRRRLRLRVRLLLNRLVETWPESWTRAMSGSDVEADVQDVAVLDDVRLPLEPLLAVARALGVRARLDEVVPADHLAADEPPRDVGVDRRCRVERGPAAPHRPGARLLLTRGEERDEVEDVEQPLCHLADGRGAVAQRGRLFVGKL